MVKNAPLAVRRRQRPPVGWAPPTYWLSACLLIPLASVLAQPAGGQKGPGGVAVRLEQELGKPIYQNSWAVLIGINQYPIGSPFRRLNYAVNDAQKVRRLLVNHYAFPAENVRVLLDGEATKPSILQALTDLADKCGAEDRVLVYFSGHGHTLPLPQGGQRGYLVPSDVTLKPAEVKLRGRVEQDCVPMTELRQKATLLAARHVLFLMDACYSGLAISGKSFTADLPQVHLPHYLKTSALRRMLGILTAGAAGEEAAEDPEIGHGFFTKKLLDAREPVESTILADTAPAREPDGVVTLAELAAYLITEVPRASRNRQHPQEAKENEGQFLFIPTLAVTKPKPPPVTPPEPLVTTATLTLASNPPGATVFIADEEKGQTPLRLTFDLGAQRQTTVEALLQRDGYQSKGERVVLQRGQKVERTIELVKLEKAKPPPTKPSTIDHQPSSIRTNPTDDAEMVWIPPGQFKMGSENGSDDEKPVHDQRVEGFWMYAKEVTNAQFQRFLKGNPQWQKERIDRKLHDGDYLKDWTFNNCPEGKSEHPVVYVSWSAAKAYAEWAGGRLPTEAEWECAARGGKQFEHGTATGELTKELANYEGSGTKPVGSYRPNPFGLYDMAGNVWEWCSSLYKPYPYSAKDGREDAQDSGSRVVRGGSWCNDGTRQRAANRYGSSPVNCYYGLVGFRVVVSAGVR